MKKKLQLTKKEINKMYFVRLNMNFDLFYITLNKIIQIFGWLLRDFMKFFFKCFFFKFLTIKGTGPRLLLNAAKSFLPVQKFINILVAGVWPSDRLFYTLKENINFLTNCD